MKKKITNRLGLPKPIVEAVCNDSYYPGTSDYTITGLLRPPRMAQLENDSEVIEDAADNLYAMQGQVIHYILQRAGEALTEQGYIVEKRFYGTFSIPGKTLSVSAQVDLFDPATGILSDYKYTSVGAAGHGLKEDHRLQLNFQAEVLRRAGFSVKAAEVVLLLRDWSAERTYEGYPKSPSLKQTVQLMPSSEITAWVNERLIAHEAAKIKLPLCSDEERWNRPTFAIMKEGGKKATKVFDSELEAKKFMQEKSLGVGYSLVKRPGEDVRCLRYCPARFICTQAKQNAPTPVLDEDGFTKVSS